MSEPTATANGGTDRATAAAPEAPPEGTGASA